MHIKYRYVVGLFVFSFLVSSMTFTTPNSFAVVTKSKKRQPIVISVSPAVNSKKAVSVKKTVVENSSNKSTIVDATSSAAAPDKSDSSASVSGGEPTGGGGGGSLGGIDTGGGFYIFKMHHNRYIDPNNPIINFTTEVAQYSGHQLDQFFNLGFRLIVYITNGTIVGNNPWTGREQDFTRVTLSSGVDQIDLSSQPTGVPIYMFGSIWSPGSASNPNGHVIAITPVYDVMKMRFPNQDPQERTGTVGSSIKTSEYKTLKSIVVPVPETQANRLQNGITKFVLVRRTQGQDIEIEPVAMTPETYRGNQTVAEYRLEFLNSASDPGYVEWELHEIPISQAPNNPQFILTSRMNQVIHNLDISFKSVGPREAIGEEYTYRLPSNLETCALIRNTFLERTYACGGMKMPPSGRNDLLPHGTVSKVFVTVPSGEDHLVISFSEINSVVDAGYDEFYFDSMKMMASNGTNPVTIYPHTFTPREWNQPIEKYGPSTRVGNVAYFDYFEPIAGGGHMLKRGGVRNFRNIVVAYNNSGSHLARAANAATNLPYMIALHDDLNNPQMVNNYYKQPFRGLTGIPDLSRMMSPSNISNRINNSFSSIYSTQMSSWLLIRPHVSAPFLVYGPKAGGTTSGAQIVFSTGLSALQYNGKGTDVGEAMETTLALADAALNRMEMDILVHPDGTPNTWEHMNSLYRNWSLFNGVIHPASAYQPFFSANSLMAARQAAHQASGQPAVPYLTNFREFTPPDEEHRVRGTTPYLPAVKLGDDLAKFQLIVRGEVTKIAYYWAPDPIWPWAYPNGSALQCILNGINTPAKRNQGGSALGRSSEYMIELALALTYKQGLTNFEKNYIVHNLAEIVLNEQRDDGLWGKWYETWIPSTFDNAPALANLKTAMAGEFGGVAADWAPADVIVDWEGLLKGVSLSHLIAALDGYPDPNVQNDINAIKDAYARFSSAVHDRERLLENNAQLPTWSIMKSMDRTVNGSPVRVQLPRVIQFADPNLNLYTPIGLYLMEFSAVAKQVDISQQPVIRNALDPSWYILPNNLSQLREEELSWWWSIQREGF